MTVLSEYIDLFAEHIQYSSSFSHNHLIRVLNHCYQVGQYMYLKHHAQNDLKFYNYACEYPELFFQKCLPIILKIMPT